MYFSSRPWNYYIIDIKVRSTWHLEFLRYFMNGIIKWGQSSHDKSLSTQPYSDHVDSHLFGFCFYVFRSFILYTLQTPPLSAKRNVQTIYVFLIMSYLSFKCNCIYCYICEKNVHHVNSSDVKRHDLLWK